VGDIDGNGPQRRTGRPFLFPQQEGEQPVEAIVIFGRRSVGERLEVAEIDAATGQQRQLVLNELVGNAQPAIDKPGLGRQGDRLLAVHQQVAAGRERRGTKRGLDGVAVAHRIPVAFEPHRGENIVEGDKGMAFAQIHILQHHRFPALHRQFNGGLGLGLKKTEPEKGQPENPHRFVPVVNG
jgi:hypothetical protein